MGIDLRWFKAAAVLNTREEVEAACKRWKGVAATQTIAPVRILKDRAEAIHMEAFGKAAKQLISLIQDDEVSKAAARKVPEIQALWKALHLKRQLPRTLRNRLPAAKRIRAAKHRVDNQEEMEHDVSVSGPVLDDYFDLDFTDDDFNNNDQRPHM